MPLPPEILRAIMQQSSMQSPVQNVGGIDTMNQAIVRLMNPNAYPGDEVQKAARMVVGHPNPPSRQIYDLAIRMLSNADRP